jgi:HAD superfamily hydrolase (TIGR01509 family)
MDAVIFDMDGVIIDSEPIYDQVTIGHLEEYGISAEPDFFNTLRGLGLLEVWQLIIDEYGLEQPLEELAEESCERLNRHFAEATGLEPMPGTRELLDALYGEGIPCALASSSRRSRIDIILRRFNLTTRFTAVVSRQDVEKSKPAPDIFLAAAKSLGARPERCIVIEDTPSGLEAARAAGMKSVGLTSGADLMDRPLIADLLVTDLSFLTPARLHGLLRGH